MPVTAGLVVNLDWKATHKVDLFGCELMKQLIFKEFCDQRLLVVGFILSLE